MSPVQSWQEDRGHFGFTVSADDTQELIRMRFWGLWDDETGAKFERAMLTALSRIPNDSNWCVLVDISNYPPQKPAVQAHHATAMKTAKLKIRKSANLVSSSLSQMQIRRLSEESGLPGYSFFTREPEALRWLREPDDESGASRSSR